MSKLEIQSKRFIENHPEGITRTIGVGLLTSSVVYFIDAMSNHPDQQADLGTAIAGFVFATGLGFIAVANEFKKPVYISTTDTKS